MNRTLTENYHLIDDIIQKYKNTQGSLITVLQKAQEIYGYLPLELLTYIAGGMGEKPANVLGVATFYTQFRLEPVGKYLIMLCQGTACHVNNSQMIEQTICEELSVENGKTTGDGMFTLKNVACLGCCSLAPAMMINGETYGNLTPAKVRKIIRDIRKNEEDKN